MKPLTTDKLVASLKRRAMLPSDGASSSNRAGGLSKQDYIDILNEEMDNGLLTHLMSTHEDYMVRKISFPLVNTNEYQIPERAIGNKVRGLFLQDDSDNLYEMTRIDLQDLPMFQTNLNYSRRNTAFQILDNKIVFSETIIQGASKIVLYFYLRPSELVEDKYAAVIQQIIPGPSTTDFIVDKIPSNFSASGLFDITGHKSPNRLHEYDITPVAINTATKTITFNNSDVDSPYFPADLVVGDYITVAQESIVPQVPTELHSLLAQRAAVAALEALGDSEGLANAKAKLGNMESKTVDLIDNRSETNVQKVNNFTSPLRINRRTYRRTR